MIKDTNRYNLYYDQYKYRAIVRILGIQWFRTINSLEQYEKRLEHKIDTKYTWSVAAGTIKNRNLSIRDLVLENNSDGIEYIKQFILWRQRYSASNIKIVINHCRALIYTNNPDDVLTLGSLVNEISWVEPIQHWQREVIYQKQPKHAFRVYFKKKRLMGDDRKKFLQFIDTEQCQPSRSLYYQIHPGQFKFQSVFYNHQIKNSFLMLFENYYLDFDDENFITMLGLRYSELIRKICRIEKVEAA